MLRDLAPFDGKASDLIVYNQATGLIRRGLDDVSRALRLRPAVLRVPVDYPTVQLAVDSALAGDIIAILPGDYEENVIVTKAITIRADSEHVRFRARDEASALVLVHLEFGKLTVENLIFEGQSGVFWDPQIAVQITQGEVILHHCRFRGWNTADASADVDGEYWEEYWRRFTLSFPILVSGHESRLEACDCLFDDSDGGVDVIQGATATIQGCSFKHIGSSISVDHGTVVSSRNSFARADGFHVGQSATVDSGYDTLIGPDYLVSASNSARSHVRFEHVTAINCSSVMGLCIGPSLIRPDLDGNWIWESPEVIIADSIICVRPNEPYAQIRYTPDVASDWGMPEIDIWHAISFTGRNLICAPPKFTGRDPAFGDITDGQVSLMPNSPALGIASDGTNLGAWQGAAT